MKVILVFALCLADKSSSKYKRKKIKIEYEYLPQGYKDQETVICQKPSTNSGAGGGGTSVLGYLTAGVVAANVAANLVNNVNSNK